MTSGAEGDEIFFCVVPEAAARLEMMDFDAGQRAAELAAPAVSREHLLVEFLVGFRLEPQARAFLAGAAHGASPIWSKTCCFCSGGRSRMSRWSEKASVEGSGFSSAAPARKSAQIISRQ